MDAHTFDRWTTALSQHPTRRTALRVLAGGLLGALLARRGSTPTRAAQFDEVGVLTDTGFYSCAAQGLTDCFGVCADVSSDPANCGACGNVCAMGDACIGGWCQTLRRATRSAPTAPTSGCTTVGTYCADLTSDPNNCGFCGDVCYPEDTSPSRFLRNHDVTVCLASGPQQRPLRLPGFVSTSTPTRTIAVTATTPAHRGDSARAASVRADLHGQARRLRWLRPPLLYRGRRVRERRVRRLCR